MSDEFILNILIDILGDPDKSYPTRSQYGFSCPICSAYSNVDRDGKGNLEINIKKGIYHCWACADRNSGKLYFLIKKWGTREQLERYTKLVEYLPSENSKDDSQPIMFQGLPKEYTLFSEANPNAIVYKEAANYLKHRKIDNDIITKYQIGFAIDGQYHHRIIIPSFDAEECVNYFVARSFINDKLKYLNPICSKDNIIFNEKFIDYSKDIYLVEGVFDHIIVDNSVPLLGKYMNELLFEKLYDNAEGNIIIALDPDAKKNTILLYKKLDGGKLKNRIKIWDNQTNYDISELHQKTNAQDFERLIRNIKILEEDYI